MFLTALVAVAMATPQTRPPMLPQPPSASAVAKLLTQPIPPASYTITVIPPAPAASYSVITTWVPSQGIWAGSIPVGAFAPPDARRIAIINPFEGTVPVSSCRIAFMPSSNFADLGGGRLKINSINPYSAGPDPAFTYTLGNPIVKSYPSVTVGWSFTVGP